MRNAQPQLSIQAPSDSTYKVAIIMQPSRNDLLLAEIIVLYKLFFF